MSVFEKITEYIGIDKIIQFSIDLIDFYFKPIKFYNNFFLKPLKDKIIQALFYSLLIIVLGYILIEKASIRELSKAMIFEIAILFKIIIILIISDLIISKIQKRELYIEKIIFFVILSKILLVPFQLVFFGLFVSYENYNYFFIENLIVFLLYIYIFIFSARVFNSKLKYIIIGICLNFLFINVVGYIIDKLSIDEYSTNETPYYTDQILKERIEKGQLILDFYNIPSYRVICKKDNVTFLSYFLFTVPFDSVSTGNLVESEKYYKNLKKNISILDTMIKNVKFKRNKAFFEQVLFRYKTIDSLYNIKIFAYSQKDIEKVNVYMKNDSLEAFKKIIIKNPDDIIKKNYKLLMDEYEIERMSYFATFPLLLINYSQPLLYKKKELKNAF
jgi:hypothetical protein